MRMLKLVILPLIISSMITGTLCSLIISGVCENLGCSLLIMEKSKCIKYIGIWTHTHAQSLHLQRTFPWLEMWWDSHSGIALLCRCPSGTVDHSSNLHLSNMKCFVCKMLFLNVLWIKLSRAQKGENAYVAVEMSACVLRKNAVVNFDHIFSSWLLWFQTPALLPTNLCAATLRVPLLLAPHPLPLLHRAQHLLQTRPANLPWYQPPRAMGKVSLEFAS